jgi:alkylation response protein AidB-like acyl-CoA dehydrogenase
MIRHGIRKAGFPPSAEGGELVGKLSDACPQLRRIPQDGYGRDGFPVAILDWLRDNGFLAAPLPAAEGGLGWGTDPSSLSVLCAALRALGYVSLVAGRIYEAHVNALVLIHLYGNAAVRAAAATDARNGHLLGLWVTPDREPVRLERIGTTVRLKGGKAFCTAAGYATRAVLTVLDEEEREHLAFIDAAGVDEGAASSLHGMRGTATKPLAFDLTIPPAHCFGEPGDYVREPAFSGGAWRTSAVTVGGLHALIDETVRQLRDRGRSDDPHQSARIGQMLIQGEAAAMWVAASANRCATLGVAPLDLTAYVNLARLAVEQACLEVIPLAQRGLGLAAFQTSNPVESLMRDLATYLRQPAGDEALCEAAVRFARATKPSSLGSLP